jgi:hypothetical protein
MQGSALDRVLMVLIVCMRGDHLPAKEVAAPRRTCGHADQEPGCCPVNDRESLRVNFLTGLWRARVRCGRAFGSARSWPRRTSMVCPWWLEAGVHITRLIESTWPVA